MVRSGLNKNVSEDFQPYENVTIERKIDFVKELIKLFSESSINPFVPNAPFSTP